MLDDDKRFPGVLCHPQEELGKSGLHFPAFMDGSFMDGSCASFSVIYFGMISAIVYMAWLYGQA
ncbi:MAG: hypothetical protein M1456_03395 [Actinobacteria bacterium]|nr:hypothetical protein [Actinomycetota bacterium]